MTLVVKKMLGNTLKELMDEKPLTKITIQDLTKKCGISRQTFYNHFHDIYELVEWIYLNEAHITLGENISYENWQDALEALFQYMDDNRNFVLNTYRSVSKENVERLLQREVERFLTDLIFNEIKVSGAEAEQVQFSIEFYTYALVGVGLDWISRQMPGTAKELVEKNRTSHDWNDCGSRFLINYFTISSQCPNFGHWDFFVYGTFGKTGVE